MEKRIEQLSLFPELESLNRNTLYVIGNGFDLAHNIKSGYWDFRDWLFANNKADLANMLDIFFSTEEDVWNGIEQALGNYDEHAILDYCRPDMEFDIEHSLRQSAIVEDSPMAEFLPVLEDFRDAFSEWVDNIEIGSVDKKYTLNEECLFLTFNYTDTLEAQYKIPSEQICHIHGSRLNNDDYIIGHNNPRSLADAWDQDGLIFEQQAQENIISWMNGFAKDYDTIIKTHNAFFNRLSTIKQIITYGHSMNEIDWPYFEVIIKIVGCETPWKISCYKEEDFKNAAHFKSHFSLNNVCLI